MSARKGSFEGVVRRYDENGSEVFRLEQSEQSSMPESTEQPKFVDLGVFAGLYNAFSANVGKVVVVWGVVTQEPDETTNAAVNVEDVHVVNTPRSHAWLERIKPTPTPPAEFGS